MNYTNLGTSGPAGLQGLPGHDGVRERAANALGHRRGRGRANLKAAVEGGVTFFDTADTYSGGAERGGHGPTRAQVPDPRRGRHRHQGVHAGDAGGERWRARAQAHPLGDRRLAAPPRAWTTSTSIRSTAGTPGRRSRRRWGRCTTSCAPARRATSAPAACSRGSSPRRSTRPSRTAGRKFVSMQNHYNLDVPRGGAGDDPALPGPGRRGASRGARWPAAFWPATAPGTGERLTTRSSTDPFTDYLYDQPTDFDVVDAAAGGCGGARRRRRRRWRWPGCWRSRG